MAAWAIQNLFNVYKEAKEILDNAELSEADKAVKIKGPNGTDHRMLNLMLLLKPAVEQADKEFGEHAGSFFEWFHERWAYIESLNVIEGACNCKGCKQDEPVENSEHTNDVNVVDRACDQNCNHS